MSPTGQAPRVVEGSPHALPMLLRAAIPSIPVVNVLPGIRRHGGELPDLALTRHDVPIDADHVAAYARVCGFPRKDTVPLTYPHLLAFGLHMSIMSDSSFPFPAIGTVHLENAVTQHRPVALTERLQVTARAENLRAHAKGRVFDMVTTVHSAGELVWEETSTFLRRGAPTGSGDDPAIGEAGSSFPEAPPTGIVWKLPADLGRRYAAVSGDHNPIHLYPLTARALGFPRQIAHGMWSKARCVAMLENRLPDAVRVQVAFKKPILLPGSVAFGSRALEREGTAPGWAFSLSSPRSGAPHLAGRTEAP
ncbi:MaoC family dehydratase [Nocardioides sp. MAHUQ-72]|uniref:MaoC family dehydratase n=1 Tax=unclassified Nocardioides TaxID=2615069 RepID=UPI003617CD48